MGLLALIAATALQAQAANIDAGTAQGMANNFLKHQVATKPGKFNAMSLTDLKLAHAEVSRTVNGAYDYYAFNLTGGGFIIVAGEDRANQVLGYSDSGHLDFSDMPDNLKALLASYKEEIEWLQSHPEINTTAPRRPTKVECESGQLQVVDHVTKFGAPFMVDDVTKLINYVLNSEKPHVSVSDVSALIHHILYN